VERYFRDAPMIVGEGTDEIQRNVIAAQLISPAAGWIADAVGSTASWPASVRA
jgi:hypothetical protein